MEVHKHPHHVTHSKKWTEYLLEFFMLFLAVFLGFVAENVREHIVEKERAKQYIESFYEDLRTDSARLNYLIGFETRKIEALNVLQSCYDSLLNNQVPVSLVNVIKNSLSVNGYLMTRRTLGQLYAAGGFRLLPKADADSILHYETTGDNLEGYQRTIYQQAQDNLRNSFSQVVDFTAYTKLYSNVVENPYPDSQTSTPLLVSTDKMMLNKYFNELFQYLRVIVAHRNWLKRFKTQSVALLNFFKNKYHLQ